MKDRYSRINWSTLQILILKCYPEILAVNCERECTFVHIEIDTKDSLSFEDSAVAWSVCIWMVSQLSDTEESPSELIVTEGCSLVTLFWFWNTNLKFMFCSCIGDYLPVVNAFCEWYISKESSEEVVIFSKVYTPSILTDRDYFFWVSIRWCCVPHKVAYNDSNDFALKS